MRDRRKSIKARWLIGALSAGALLVLSACGSSGSTPSSKKADEPEPLSRVELAMGPVTEWTGPTESVKPPAGAKVTIVSCDSAEARCALAAAAAEAAATELGWTATVVDGDARAKAWQAAADKAVSAGHDAIILAGADPAQMSSSIDRAKAANIPVVAIFSPPTDSQTLDGHIVVDYADSGETLGEFFGETAKAPEKILLLEAEHFPGAPARYKAFKETIKKECSDCTTSSQSFEPITPTSRLDMQVTSLLSIANPKADYLYAPYEATTPLVLDAMKAAERDHDVPQPKLIAVDSSPEAFERIKSGKQFASLVNSPTYMGWLAIDQTARLLAGEKVEAVQIAPEHLVTADNAKNIDGTAGWQLEIDFQSKFRELWGLAG